MPEKQYNEEHFDRQNPLPEAAYSSGMRKREVTLVIIHFGCTYCVIAIDQFFDGCFANCFLFGILPVDDCQMNEKHEGDLDNPVLVVMRRIFAFPWELCFLPKVYLPPLNLAERSHIS